MTGQKQRQKGGIIVIGFALFAMFFGAGNLIFPPKLGFLAGTNWVLGFIAFAVIDVGIAAVAVYAMSRGDGTVAYVTNIIGDKLGVVINTAVVLCIGPFLAIPRTGTTTFEMAIQSINPDISKTAEVIFLFAFFAITFLLTIRQSKVIDIIGKVLTPLLVIALVALIVKGVVTPISPEIQIGMDSASVINEGIINGYQTMDVLAALCFSIIVVDSARQKGYEEKKECSRAMMGACGVSAILLLFVYGGLTFLGATTLGVFEEGLDNAKLLMMIIQELLGYGGMVLLGVIVGLACLTTSIGLTSSTAAYFETLFKGKVSYKTLVIIVTVFSFAVSNVGLSTIISIASPVLSLLYPVIIILVVCSLFKERLERCYLPGAACLVAFILTCFSTLETFGMEFAFLDVLPLNAMGLGWICPALIAGLIGFFVPRKPKAAEKV